MVTGSKKWHFHGFEGLERATPRAEMATVKAPHAAQHDENSDIEHEGGSNEKAIIDFRGMVRGALSGIWPSNW
uniref:Uncharacterized protein n=1 Tax=Globodera pallida TaxID=36090 RepID=A0A183BMP4_GLOPA